MTFRTLAVLLAVLGTADATADLKPDALDCNAKKAARNATMNATVGISGRCDTGKAAKNTKDDISGNIKDSVDLDREREKQRLNGDKGKRALKK